MMIYTRYYTVVRLCDGQCGIRIERTEPLGFKITKDTQFHIDKAGEYRFIVLEIKSGYIKIKRIP